MDRQVHCVMTWDDDPNIAYERAMSMKQNVHVSIGIVHMASALHTIHVRAELKIKMTLRFGGGIMANIQPGVFLLVSDFEMVYTHCWCKVIRTNTLRCSVCRIEVPPPTHTHSIVSD